MSKFNVTDVELARISQETHERDQIEPRAKTVRYDEKSARLMIELKNGVVFMVPIQLVQGLADAQAMLISQVELDSRGYGLNWDALGVTLSVPGLLAGIFGSPEWMEKLHSTAVPTAADMGRKGGRARTNTKAASSRANGTLGGRPRKKIA